MPVRQNSRFHAWVLPVLIGGIGAFGQAPWGLLAPTLLMVALAFVVLPMTFRAGWLVAFGYFLVTLHWLVEPFLVDIARHGWMAPFGVTFMSGGLALFWGLAFWAAGRWRLGIAGLVALWTLAEVTRALVLTGFPWALVGHAAIGTGWAQLAAFIGPHGLTCCCWRSPGWVRRSGVAICGRPGWRCWCRCLPPAAAGTRPCPGP